MCFFSTDLSLPFYKISFEGRSNCIHDSHRDWIEFILCSAVEPLFFFFVKTVIDALPEVTRLAQCLKIIANPVCATDNKCFLNPTHRKRRLDYRAFSVSHNSECFSMYHDWISNSFSTAVPMRCIVLTEIFRSFFTLVLHKTFFHCKVSFCTYQVMPMNTLSSIIFTSSIPLFFLHSKMFEARHFRFQ